VGLDAVVYRNREHLEMGSDNARANMAQQTGEVYFEDNQLSRKYQHKVEAVAHRLGNVAEISALREEASGLIDPECFVIRKVLYSGTHSLGSSQPNCITFARLTGPRLRCTSWWTR